MLELLGTAAASILGGGATGILGAAIQRFADFKNKQLDLESQRDKMAHESVMRDKDAAIMAQEWAGRTQVAQIEGDAAENTADTAAFAASFKTEPAQYSAGVKTSKGQSWVLVLVDALRAVVRPGLTVYLCILTTLIYTESKRFGAALTPDQALDVYRLIVGTILYLTTTVVLWWFGTRNKGAQPK